ncbi:kinesin light chain 1, partial [Cladorrhinum sp. PSN332]
FSIAFSLSGVSEVDHFVAREEELNSIHKLLGKGSGRRTALVHGLGGMGKTQLAIAYAKRHQSDYSAIFWLNAKDETSLKQGFAKVAERILRRHPSVLYIRKAMESRNLNEAVQAVKRWLDHVKNDRWLVIYDNYDNPKLGGGRNDGPNNRPDIEGDRDTNIAKGYDIRPFLPDTYHGAILITTRSSIVKLGQQIPVRELKDYRDSLAILSHSSNRQDILKDVDAVELARKLDGLPLALSTAGAYLNNMAITFAEYLEMYQKSWLDLHKTTPQLHSYEDRALHTTWNISYTQVEQQSPIAAKLLKLWAFFDNDDLWFELLCSGRSDGPQWFQELTENKISFVEAVRVLCNYGLIETNMLLKAYRGESRGYGMHGCVHSWTVHVLNEVRDTDMAKLALRCIGSHVPSRLEHEYWIVQRRLMQHAGSCLKMVIGRMLMTEGDEWCLVKIGQLFADQDRLSDAEAIYQRALKGYEKALGPDHTSTLHTVNNLGLLYLDQGRLGEAEAMYQRALEGKEKALGPDHTSTLDTVNNLGILYIDQGRLGEAEAMYQRALEGYEKALGPDHTSTLNTVNNLGLLYIDQGRLREAEAMYQRALSGFQTALGPSHWKSQLTMHDRERLRHTIGIFAVW